MFFYASAGPSSVYGACGDLWLRTTPGAEDLYYKDRNESWVPIARDYAKIRSPRQHVYHPWLNRRTLQFDGTKLGWFQSDQWLRSRAPWDEWLRRQTAVPPNPDGKVQWVARYLAQRVVPKDATLSNSTVRPQTPVVAGAAVPSKPEAARSDKPSASNTESRTMSTPRTLVEPTAVSSSSGSGTTSPPSSTGSKAPPPSTSEIVSSSPDTTPTSRASATISAPSPPNIAVTSPSANSKPTPPSPDTDTASSSKENAPAPSVESTSPNGHGPRSLVQTASIPETGPHSRLIRTGLMTALLSAHIRAVPLQDSTNAPPVRNVTCPSRSTKEPKKLQDCAPTRTREVVVKQEEGEPPRLGTKRPRGADSAASAEVAPSKRIKTEEDDDAARQLLQVVASPQNVAKKVDEEAAPNILARTVNAPAPKKAAPVSNPAMQSSVEARRNCAVEKYLARLPVPLNHHTPLFLSLGIADMVYIKAIASMPQQVLNELILALECHGLSFVEALVLRDALDASCKEKVRVSRRAELLESPGAAIESFLSSLRPSMVHHAPVFRESGLHVHAHLSILFAMEAHRYAEFETRLRGKGLSWMDCFIIRVAVQC